MNGIYLASFVTLSCSGTYPVVSSKMGMGDAVATPYFATVLVLEMEITILYEKITLDLVVTGGNISLKCSRVN